MGRSKLHTKPSARILNIYLSYRDKGRGRRDTLTGQKHFVGLGFRRSPSRFRGVVDTSRDGDNDDGDGDSDDRGGDDDGDEEGSRCAQGDTQEHVRLPRNACVTTLLKPTSATGISTRWSRQWRILRTNGYSRTRSHGRSHRQLLEISSTR